MAQISALSYIIPLSGNASDKTSFREAVLRHAGQLQNAGVEVLVTDSAGYNQDTLQTLNQTDVTWVMGLPATLMQAKKLLDGSVVSDFSSLVEGMECSRVDTVYAGVKQRWLVIRSDPKSPSLAARERARGSAERQLLKRSEEERKRFDRLRTQEFSCEADARAALLAYQASCRVLDLIDPKVRARKHYPKAGRPAREAIPERVSYQIEGSVAASTKSFEEQLERASRFIVATNDTSGERLSDVGVLQAYKGRWSGASGS